MDLSIPEDERVELWRLDRLVRLGFDGDEVSLLLFWKADVHAAEDLLFRDGERTACTHEQAVRILMPIDLPVIELEPELALAGRLAPYTIHES